MCQDRGNSSLELLDLLSKLVEVIIKCSHLDVHDVIFGLTELVDGGIELRVDLFKTVSQSSSFGVSDFDFIKLLELQYGVCKMHDVLASLKEAIKSDKQSVRGDLPLVLGLSLVVKVGILELVANINSKSEAFVSLDSVQCFDKSKDLWSVHLIIALSDDGVTDLSDQHYKS